MENTFTLGEKARILYQTNDTPAIGLSLSCGDIVLTQAKRDICIDPNSVEELCAALREIAAEAKE